MSVQVRVVDDRDVTVLQGDVLGCLGSLADGSVDCVVTSPPYWGLRDYGTGSWVGGDDPDCEHRVREDPRAGSSGLSGGKGTVGHQREGFRGSCGRCGALRVDRQLGLEASPEEFIERLTGVFREVRRVLAAHGTCWVNMGDSFDGKQLVGMPWRLALALQADGWWLRSDIIWAKPNPMPESVTDRPTKSHEHVFLLTKSARYFYDADAVREPHSPDGRRVTRHPGPGGFSVQARSNGDRWPGEGRNMRDVWEIATEPFPGAHFATFPQKLVERCLKAGCPERVCEECGEPSVRIVGRGALVGRDAGGNYRGRDIDRGVYKTSGTPRMSYERIQAGWSDCGHDSWRPGVVLDPFLGSGTTAVVARRLGFRAVGIELNPEYCEMAARRLGQQSLLA